MCVITIRLFSAHSTNRVEKYKQLVKWSVPCAMRGQTKPNTVFITLCSNFHKPFFIVVGSSTVSSNHLLRVLYYILKMKSTEKNGSSPPTYCSGRTTSQPASQPTAHSLARRKNAPHIKNNLFSAHSK